MIIPGKLEFALVNETDGLYLYCWINPTLRDLIEETTFLYSAVTR